MGKLASGLNDTRRDLDKALGQDWKDLEPSWATEPPLSAAALAARSFPRDLDLSRDMAHAPAPRHPHIERDLGPDLGMGL